jgi:hypothetical protein
VRAGLEVGGHDIGIAQRLLETLEATLTEWEHHRRLIKERITYLEHKVAEDVPRREHPC